MGLILRLNPVEVNQNFVQMLTTPCPPAIMPPLCLFSRSHSIITLADTPTTTWAFGVWVAAEIKSSTRE